MKALYAAFIKEFIWPLADKAFAAIKKSLEEIIYQLKRKNKKKQNTKVARKLENAKDEEELKSTFGDLP